MQVKINGKWLDLSTEFVANHPGGPVITQYRNADATHVFHAFHEGSAKAYKQLKLLEKNSSPRDYKVPNGQVAKKDKVDLPLSTYQFTVEQELEMIRNFEDLRQKVHSLGLMNTKPWFYAQKVIEVISLMTLVFLLQAKSFYICSAIILALCWQQLGWLTHEFCHHQPSKNRRFNDWLALLFGNVAQGFSKDWWKDKHNAHHAATNILEKDADIDLAPLLALVPVDLQKYSAPLERFIIRVIVPYQHLYYPAMFPLLRFSWTFQSLIHAFNATHTGFTRDEKNAAIEQIGLIVHWTWVSVQLWLLPSNLIRLAYFSISQLGAGVLIAHVVSYNHNSTPKFQENSPILNNFSALHILTTRNMRASPLVDWLWGGLNYQIEHHLFPTMPRPNLFECSKLVRQFCAKNGLIYMEDDYWTGYLESIRLLQSATHLIQQSFNQIPNSTT